jgi:hypothetical protein
VADGRALWHYRDGRWDGPRAPADMAMLDAEEIAVGPDGAVWMTAEDGVAVLANGTWTSIATEGAPGTLAVDADATAWVPAGDGSAGEVLAINRDPAVPIRRFSCPNPVGSLAAASDGSIYVAGEPASPSQSGGLSRISGTACTPVDPVGDGGTHGVQGIASGPSGSLAAVVLVPAEPVPAAQGATAQEAAAQDTPAPSTAARTDEPSGAVAWEAPAEAGPTVAVTMLYDGTRWTEIDRSETLEVEVFFDPQGRLWRSRDDRFEHLDGTHWVSGDLEVGPGGMDLSIAPDGTYWLVGWGSEVYRIQAER